jgi:hypothetical protein
MRFTRIAALSALLSASLLSATNAYAGLILSPDGMTVTDTSTGATWLANMDLPASMPLTVPLCASMISPDCINTNGSMNYQTAELWIAALNADNSVGYLGRNNWQLPTTQPFTAGCMSFGKNGESFGYGCTGSALGSLYSAIGLTAPSSVAGAVGGTFKGFANLQPNYYWSGTPSDSVGFFTFSFANGWRGANIGLDVAGRNPAANFFYVLPMLDGNPGIPGTIYDPVSGKSWLADGNIAATNSFGLAQCSGLGSATSAPCVNADGTMTETSAEALINAMNSVVNNDGTIGYLGETHWRLPPSIQPVSCHDSVCTLDSSENPLASLYYNLLGLNAGNSVASYYTSGIGPFFNAQPYLYWSCQAENAQGSALNSVCSLLPQCTTTTQPNPCAADMEWSFNLGDGLQGTDEEATDLFVTAFSPSTVPEPAGWALLMSGLSILAVTRRPRPKRKTDNKPRPSPECDGRQPRYERVGSRSTVRWVGGERPFFQKRTSSLSNSKLHAHSLAST